MERVGRHESGCNERDIGPFQTHFWMDSIGHHVTELYFLTRPLLFIFVSKMFPVYSMRLEPTFCKETVRTVDILQMMKDILAVCCFHTTGDAPFWCADFKRLPHAAINDHNRQWRLVSAQDSSWELQLFLVFLGGRGGLEQYVVSDRGAPVALPRCLPRCKLPTNVLYCHYPPRTPRLYHNYWLICLWVSLPAFSAPIFNHPSITKGCFLKGDSK